MYPGKLLSLANKGWSWAPLLKHVGFEWKKKVSYMWKKKERKENYEKSLKNFGANKVKIKRSKFWRNSKSWRYQKSIQIRCWIQRNQRSKCQRNEEFK